MGISRLLYGKFGEKVDLTIFMMASGVMCLVCYLIAGLAGDLGGAVGPAIIDNVSQKAANNLRAGFLAGIGFPIVLVISVLYIRRKYR